MELVTLLRVLWRCRTAVILGVVIALALGWMATQGPKTRLGVASMRIVLDTPNSQTVDVRPHGAPTLAWRAALVADLMGSAPRRGTIAREMGIRPEELEVTAPYRGTPEVAAPLPRAAIDASVPTAPYQVAIQAVGPLPIIGIDVTAPSPERAVELAAASAEAVRLASRAAAGRGLQRVVVENVGPAKAREVVDGPRRMIGLMVAVMVVGVWCAGVALLDGLLRRRRVARRRIAARQFAA